MTLEDDEGRLLRAARRIAEAPHPLPIRIGVNRGHVFAGDIGTEYRRTFTVMGDTVNLAARLMAAAQPGDVLATASVLDHARTQFATEALEPFSVKGKSEPVQAFRVGRAVGSRPDSFGTLPFRGRDKESATLLDALKSTTAGRGRTVLVDAERGVGKTRSHERVRNVRLSRGRSCGCRANLIVSVSPTNRCAPRCAPSSASTPATVTMRGANCWRRWRSSTAGLLPFAPLLAAVVEADVPSTPESDAIAEEFVRPRIADLVVSTLDAACQTPLLLVAEDAHWFDDSTSDICGRLSAAAAAAAAGSSA